MWEMTCTHPMHLYTRCKPERGESLLASIALKTSIGGWGLLGPVVFRSKIEKCPRSYPTEIGAGTYNVAHSNFLDEDKGGYSDGQVLTLASGTSIFCHFINFT